MVSTPRSVSKSTRVPVPLITLLNVRMSLSTGTLEIVVGEFPSSAAAMRGNAPFLEPLTGITPLSGVGPSTTNLSKVSETGKAYMGEMFGVIDLIRNIVPGVFRRRPDRKQPLQIVFRIKDIRKIRVNPSYPIC